MFRIQICCIPSNRVTEHESYILKKELLCSSTFRFPPNRTNGVSVSKGSPIRYIRGPIRPSVDAYQYKALKNTSCSTMNSPSNSQVYKDHMNCELV